MHLDTMHDDVDDARPGYRWNDWRVEDHVYARTTEHRRRVERARDVIAQWLRACPRPYIAFSGGKDSVAVLGLVQSVAPDPIPVMWHNSGVEWPGVPVILRMLKARGLVRDWIEVRSDVDVIALKQKQERGEISASKKDKLALFDPVDNAVNRWKFTGGAIGLRQEESSARRIDGAVHGEIYRKTDGYLRCCPINRWSWRDVYAYIADEQLPLHPIYSAPLDGLEHRGRIRLSWWLSTDNQRHGELGWIKRNYWPVYAEIVRLIPSVASAV